jgi:signal transduction histidine kinase/ActR/RegA family two-component response regulator
VQRRLLAAGSVIFVLAVGGGLLFSRRMSRPLRDLADASEDIAGGNWTRQVPVRGSTEATMMAQAFNQMTTSLRHWYEQAKKRDDELRQAQKLEAIGRLAGGVAHDFNNLLTAIKGYGELLRGELDTGDPRRADADEIVKAADRAAALTRQLLTFSRRQVVAPRVLALDRIMANTEQMLRRVIGEDVTLTTTVTPALGMVRADASQVEQVLLNLAVNARDAMAHGGALHLELANVAFDSASLDRPPTLAPGRYVRLSVTDTGCGMTKETMSRIFEPFFTTKEEGRGTGLGLAMVYGIVEQAGGAIEVESQVGRGTTFHLYFPETSERDEPSGPEAGAAPSRSTGDETVLLVEDEQRVATFLATALRKAGYTVLEAMRADQALEIVRSHAAPIDLLLTDVVMPGMNGRELADRVRQLRRETRVVYMSGYSDDAILRHGVQTATAHFIQKPFSLEALTAKIREALSRSGASLL